MLFEITDGQNLGAPGALNELGDVDRIEVGVEGHRAVVLDGVLEDFLGGCVVWVENSVFVFARPVCQFRIKGGAESGEDTKQRTRRREWPWKRTRMMRVT